MNIDKVFKIVITVLADTTNIFTSRAGPLSGLLNKWTDLCDLPADAFRKLADMKELNGFGLKKLFYPGYGSAIDCLIPTIGIFEHLYLKDEFYLNR
jgi:hypothetical protein